MTWVVHLPRNGGLAQRPGESEMLIQALAIERSQRHGRLRSHNTRRKRLSRRRTLTGASDSPSTGYQTNENGSPGLLQESQALRALPETHDQRFRACWDNIWATIV